MTLCCFPRTSHRIKLRPYIFGLQYLSKNEFVWADKLGFISDVEEMGNDALWFRDGMVPIIVKDGAVERRPVFVTSHHERTI